MFDNQNRIVVMSEFQERFFNETTHAEATKDTIVGLLFNIW